MRGRRACSGSACIAAIALVLAASPATGTLSILTRGAQELANRTKNLILPANKAAEVRPEAARFASAPTIDVDAAKFGTPAEKKRLLTRWQREIGDAPN